MTLTLEVTGANAATVAERRKTFHESGGTIGRSNGGPTHWRLPDPKVSNNHAEISYANGTFFILDRSTNGVFVGAPGNRLEFRTPYPLNSGDTLFIEPYTVRVTLESAASKDLRANDPPSDPLVDLFDRPTPKPLSPLPSIQSHEPDPSRDPYVIPANWQEDSSTLDPPRADPKPEPTPRPSNDVGSDWLKALLRGAGLENVDVTPELGNQFGRILRVVVEGAMSLLDARQELKGELGLEPTVFRRADNNPLKFSTSVEDALHNLLVKRVAGYLGPVEAFEDAFDDIRNHQVAMLVGLRAGFEAVLQYFDPARLQEEFDHQAKKAALVSMPSKLRYWDQYSATFHDMVRDSEACYSKLFGDEFARAYEEQLSRLKGQSRPPKR